MLLSRFLYDFAIRIYVAGIALAAVLNPKAARWQKGRRDWRERYAPVLQPKKAKRLWVHVASLGEFEQGRPVIEDFRTHFPDWDVMLTFFSPSGYEIRKNYAHAAWIGYLPADTSQNARDFLKMLQPDLVIFVKYEFWYHYLSVLKKQKVPALLISALFRPGQPFFKPWGGLWREMLGSFQHIFVQDADSLELLARIGIENATVAGDTRIDRVLQLKENASENAVFAAFSAPDKIIVAGSTWPDDEALLCGLLKECPTTRLLIAPHEPSEANVETLTVRLPVNALRYSQANEENAGTATVLIIDNVGLLNTAYRYGHLAYIGGGFGKGIHNTLEPAAFGLPILFGPRFQKFAEARAFTELQGAFSVRNQAELIAAVQQLENAAFYTRASAAVFQYLEEQKGATERIIRHISTTLSY